MGPMDLEAAYRERNIMQTLQHPNIMRIKDYFEDENNMYLVMNYRVDDLRNLFT